MKRTGNHREWKGQEIAHNEKDRKSHRMKRTGNHTEWKGQELAQNKKDRKSHRMKRDYKNHTQSKGTTKITHNQKGQQKSHTIKMDNNNKSHTIKMDNNKKSHRIKRTRNHTEMQKSSCKKKNNRKEGILVKHIPFYQVLVINSLSRRKTNVCVCVWWGGRGGGGGGGKHCRTKKMTHLQIA